MQFIQNDLGQRRAIEMVEITFTSGADVRLMNSSNFSSYQNGRRHHYIGGLATKSAVRLQIPISGHWHVAIDIQGLRGSTRASVRMLPGALPDMRDDSLSSLHVFIYDNVPPAPDFGSKDAEGPGMQVHLVDLEPGSYRFNVQSRYRARGRSDTAGTFLASAMCRCGTYLIPQGPQRATGERERADRRPRLGGPEEYKRSTRSPGGGAWRRSAGMRPDSLSSPEDGLGKRLRPYFFNGFSDDHVRRSKKGPIYWLITSPKGTLQALTYLHRYNRDTVNRFPGGYLRPYQQKLEAKRVRVEHVLTGGGSSQSEKAKDRYC